MLLYSILLFNETKYSNKGTVHIKSPVYHCIIYCTITAQIDHNVYLMYAVLGEDPNSQHALQHNKSWKLLLYCFTICCTICNSVVTPLSEVLCKREKSNKTMQHGPVICTEPQP